MDTPLEQQVKELKMIAIRNAASAFDEFIGKSTAGIIVDWEDATILRATPQACKLFGYEPGELFLKNIRDLMPVRIRDIHDQHFKSFKDNPEPRQMGERHMSLIGLKKDNAEFNIEISLFPGEVVGQKIIAAIIMQSRAVSHGL